MSATALQQSEPQTLEQWTRVLCEQEMPIFSNTAHNIYNTLDDKNKGAMELASIILQDPNLTTKLLKLSNTLYYNPSRQKINTVSRAIVILGSELIRELTLACSFFESIVSSDNKQRANEEIGHAIHAAVQAKELAISCHDSSPEEVFIASLLQNIGSIAFWCFGGKQCQYIVELIQSGNFSHPQAETKVLGFELLTLSKSLSKSWHLGGLIEEAIKQPSSSNPRVETVHLAKEITAAINQGWESEAMSQCLEKLEKRLNDSQSSIKSHLKKNTESAIKIACQFGAHDASRFIHSDLSQQTPVSLDETILDKKQIQVNILQDITTHISGLIDLNLLFQMIVEGIHRGIGMDRTLFCLLSANKKTLNEKLSLGWLKNINAGKIKLELSSHPINLFFKVINNQESLWANPKQDKDLFTTHVTNTIGCNECFLIPIHSDNKPIGLIFCDRSISKQPLTAEDFKSAQHFSQQAVIGLSLFKIKKGHL